MKELVSLPTKFKVKSIPVYTILGIILWFCILKSGIHATIAGVLLGMVLPIGKTVHQYETSISHRFEHALTPISAFIIMPIFALANAGITIDISSLSTIILEPVSLGIIFGLFFGKPIGIFGVSYILVKFKIASLPVQVTKRHLYGASVLGGIGFTMSIFVSSLSFADETVLATAKISIMIASIIAAVLGAIVFKIIDVIELQNKKQIYYDMDTELEPEYN